MDKWLALKQTLHDMLQSEEIALAFKKFQGEQSCDKRAATLAEVIELVRELEQQKRCA